MWKQVDFGKTPMTREVAPPRGDMLGLKTLAEHHHITQNTNTTFKTAFGIIEHAYQKQARTLRGAGAEIPWVMDVPVEDRIIRCGYYGLQGRSLFGVHIDSADGALAIRDAHARKVGKHASSKEARPDHWVTHVDHHELPPSSLTHEPKGRE